MQSFFYSRNLTLSTGKFAKFADGSAVAGLGDTAVMVTTVSKTKPSSSNFLPLTVDFRQKAAAAGRIPTNFLRRELGPSEREILTSRLIDRSLRPLFPLGYSFETQVMCNLLAVDSVNDPDVMCINAASAALAVSDIPWNGPVGAVRVGLHGSDILINPTRREQSQSSLDLVVTATSQNLVVMLEAAADNVLQQDFLKAIKTGVKECQHVINAIIQLQKLHGKVKREYVPQTCFKEDIFESVRSCAEMRLREIFRDYNHDKISRDVAVSNLRNEVVDTVKQSVTDCNESTILESFNKIGKDVFRALIFEENIR